MTRKARVGTNEAGAPPDAAEAPAPRAKASKTSKAAAEETAETVGRKPDFFFAGQPVFRCRFCWDRYERVNDLASVEEHERTQHPTNLRVSQVLGPDGRPLIVKV